MSASVEVEQAFHCLHILDLVMKDLALDGFVLECEDQAHIEGQNQSKNEHVPESEPGAELVSQRARHACGSRRLKPSPLMVCRIFVGKGSSTLRRRRAIWTSMTLSNGVNRDPSFHTSRASISRETVRPRCSARNRRTSNSRDVRSSCTPARKATRALGSRRRSPIRMVLLLATGWI